MILWNTAACRGKIVEDDCTGWSTGRLSLFESCRYGEKTEVFSYCRNKTLALENEHITHSLSEFFWQLDFFLQNTVLGRLKYRCNCGYTDIIALFLP